MKHINIIVSQRKITWCIFQMLYLVALLIALYMILTDTYPIVYPRSFSGFRLLNGVIWCLFFGFVIKDDKSPSAFFAILTHLIQIIPLTATYAINGGSALYYNSCCLGFLLFIIIVQYCRYKEYALFLNLHKCKNFLYIAGLLIVIILMLEIFRNNGVPGLKALNIYDVYEIRSSNQFIINKYFGYIMKMCMYVIIPMLMTISYIKKRRIIFLFLLMIDFALYLYSGHKVILFSIPITILCIFISKRKNANSILAIGFPASVGVLVLGALCSCEGSIFRQAFSLIIRRVLLLPARIKFCYADFFSENKLMGLHGILPTLLVPGQNPYSGVTIGVKISEIYFQNTSNSSTGFLGEAVQHFGVLGVFIAWIVFALIICLLDCVYKKTSYLFVIGSFAVFVYSMNDGLLLGSLIAGPAGIIILIAIFIIGERVSGYRQRIV